MPNVINGGDSELVEAIESELWGLTEPGGSLRDLKRCAERIAALQANATAEPPSGVMEALERALLGADNILGQLEAHQENTGEHLEPEDQAVVDDAKADLAFARAALQANATAPVQGEERA